MTFLDQPRVPPGAFTGGRWLKNPNTDPTIDLDNQPLIDLSPAAVAVIDAVTAAGGRPLIVGGSVRDALLGAHVESKDIDIEVHGLDSHEPLLAALAPLGHVMERGAVFGVVAIKVGDEDFDVSLPRRDSKTGDGHTGFTVEFDPHLDEHEAFGRRDFTINAIGWDPATGELIDPYDGAADLRAGVLRHTSDAFTEDPLRVLRGVQFAARFGFTMAPETAELSRSIADQYSHLSTSRVWGEWQKIATRGTHISNALAVLEQTGWILHYPDLAVLRTVEQDPSWHAEGDVLVHAGLAADQAAANAAREGLSGDDREVAVLGALVHDFGKATHTQHGEDGRIRSHGHAGAGAEPAARFLGQIGAPWRVIERIVPIVREHMTHVSHEGRPTKVVVRRLIRRLGENDSGTTIADWARVVDADVTGRGPSAKPPVSGPWLEVAAELQDRMKPILTGHHLIQRGWEPPIAFRAVLAEALTAQDEEAFDDEAGALAWLDEHGDAIKAANPFLPSKNRKPRKQQKGS